MATRTYTFTTGIETSDAPTGAAPSATGDIMTLGYADTTYARRRDWGFTAADYTALKAIGTTGDDQRYDGQTRLVTGTGELWQFDADSAATEDGSTILAPTSGTGRWLIASGSGGAGGSGSGFESLTQKLELDYQTSYQTDPLDNSVGRAFIGEDFWEGVTGALLDNDGVSGATGISIVWNARTVNDSSLNIDATTNWTVQNAGATLTASSTAGDFKVGTAGLKFDKNGTATTATIRYDRGSQDLSLAAHWRMFFWCKLPSLTNLSNVIARVYADTTSNFATWNLSSNYNGQALIAGWNLMFVDLSTTPTSTGGTGWTKASLARYIELGVTASSAAQTYTGIIFDSLYFSFGDSIKLGARGQQHTIFNSSTKQNIIIDVGNTSGDGFVSIASPLTAAYTGGLTSSNAFIQRSVLKTNTGKVTTFDSNFQSGTVSLSQECRMHATLRESQSGNFQGFVDFWQPQTFLINNVSGNSVSGIDFGNVSSDCLSGDTFNWFRPYYGRENVRYIYMGDKVISSNSTYDSTNGYINLPTTSGTGLSGGDILSKQTITSEFSLVSTTSNESFTSFTNLSSPNGKQLINDYLPYPQPNKVYFHYRMGGINTTDAYRSRFGSNTTSLSSYLVGTINTGGNFLSGRFSATGWSSSNYFRDASQSLIGGGSSIGKAMFSVWAYLVPFTATSRYIIACHVDNGINSDQNYWTCFAEASSNNITLLKTSGGSTSSTVSLPFKPNAWNYIVFSVQGGQTSFLYVNGQYSSLGNGAITGTPAKFRIGMSGFDTSPILPLNSSDRLADLVAWSGSTDLTAQQCDALYNGGNFKPFGEGYLVREKYQLTGQSGQKLSMKAIATKNTVNVPGPFIKKMGVIKT